VAPMRSVIFAMPGPPPAMSSRPNLRELPINVVRFDKQHILTRLNQTVWWKEWSLKQLSHHGQLPPAKRKGPIRSQTHAKQVTPRAAGNGRWTATNTYGLVGKGIRNACLQWVEYGLQRKQWDGPPSYSSDRYTSTLADSTP